MSRDPSSHAPPVECPRCGYDLEGIVASFTNSCPLEGTCAECGLVFHWADILDPLRAVPPWFFEHSHQRIIPFFRTVFGALRPNRFWSAIRLPYRLRLARLLFLLILIYGVVHLLIGAVTLITALEDGEIYGLIGTLIPPGSVSNRDIISPLAWPYAFTSGWHHGFLGASPWMYITLTMFILTPAAFVALPATLKRCKILPGHLLRIWVYSLIGLPLILLPFLLTVRGSFFPPSIRPVTAYFGSWTGLAFTYFGVLPLLAFVWLIFFWRAACIRYLKLTHAPAVAFTMCLCALLASIVIWSFAHPRFFYDPVVLSIGDF